MAHFKELQIFEVHFHKNFDVIIRHTNLFLKYTAVHGPPDLHAVAHRLRTTGLEVIEHVS